MAYSKANINIIRWILSIGLCLHVYYEVFIKFPC